MRVMGPLHTHYGHTDICRTFVGADREPSRILNIGEKSGAFSSCHILLAGVPPPLTFRGEKMLAAAAR